MSAPFVLGLTGSIGMGKSTTAAMFAAQGVPVWDADAVVHRLYAAGGAAVEPVAALRPAALRDGALDRSALKAWISDDPTALKQIEAIVHPLVTADRAAFLTTHRAQGTPLVVLDIPLLFEAAGLQHVDAIVVVSTDPDTQRARVLARNSMTEDQFQAILARQIPDSEKRARADFVIETSTFDATRHAVAQLVSTIEGRNIA
ncbi:dephospho-CoA kinase [Roseicitreum antarcticum]|uniref:Dephospho-CoA kinase n=1 Tax=Roseicitreum antarcticum TaxID=564137 RepID=A0A1H2QZY5_9RHOB|nr:dephospho-CoA kinase [Roseicitreum antarcticum]SDW12498.1 dephospho-CoA kinase [Roseicitreum antarcticum]